MNSNLMRLFLFTISAASIVAVVQGDAVSTISVTLCGLVNGVRAIVGALAIALFLLGGALYSIANMLPTSLEYRKNLIGWAQAMIIGGLIGFIVVILAQPIVSLFGNIGSGLGGGGSVPPNLIVC
jgi:hypothetical protein